MEQYCKRFNNKVIKVYSLPDYLYNILNEKIPDCLTISVNTLTNNDINFILNEIKKNRNNAIKIIFILKSNLKETIFVKNISEELKEFLLTVINSNILQKYKQYFKTKYYNFFEEILKLEEESVLNRVHLIFSYKEGDLKKEIFTVEGIRNSVLIANNYDLYIEKAQNVDFIKKLIDENENIKARNKNYIQQNLNNFYYLKVDNIIIGIFEIKQLENDIYELGALALLKNWQGKGLGKKVINTIFEQINKKLLIITPNDALKAILQNYKINSDKLEGGILKRYNKMLDDNKKDGKKREMFATF